jgi:hypothetical protein
MEAATIDGFAPQIPLNLLRNTDASKAIAWVAIETADHPWPKIAGKDYTAGPLYVVWTGPEVASIRSEFWAYHLAKFESSFRRSRAGPGSPSIRACLRTIPCVPARRSTSLNACLVTN